MLAGCRTIPAFAALARVFLLRSRVVPHNIIWFVEQCLQNALRLETYIQDADRDGDSELADFFRRAQHESQKGAEQGKALLKSRL